MPSLRNCPWRRDSNKTASGKAGAVHSASFSSQTPGAMVDVAALGFADGYSGTGTETLTFAPLDTNASGYAALLPQETVTLSYSTAEAVTCFAAGTRLATSGGECPVERLRKGDMVMTATGEARPIVWIGRRSIHCARHADPAAVRPIRIRAGAFGPKQPSRDLFLSPDHAVFVQEVLIPLKYLIDGEASRRTRRDRVTYYHVELASHDVLLADGLSVESYLDTGDRECFDGGSVVRLHPEFGVREPSRIWDAAGYAPLVVSGPKFEEVRARFSSRNSPREPSAAAQQATLQCRQ